MKNHHSHDIMQILFQYRNIRHFLGMYTTKGRASDIFNCSTKKRWCPHNTDTLNCPQLPVGALLYQWSVGLHLTKFYSRLSTFLEMAPKRWQESRAEKRKKKKVQDDALASLAGRSMFNQTRIWETCC